MRAIFIIAILIYGAWSYYSKNKNSLPFSTKSKSTVEHNFKCDGRQHCSQMRSYEEAKFFTDNCPATKMDGDHDGIPCERQFGRH